MGTFSAPLLGQTCRISKLRCSHQYQSIHYRKYQSFLPHTTDSKLQSSDHFRHDRFERSLFQCRIEVGSESVCNSNPVPQEADFSVGFGQIICVNHSACVLSQSLACHNRTVQFVDLLDSPTNSQVKSHCHPPFIFFILELDLFGRCFSLRFLLFRAIKSNNFCTFPINESASASNTNIQETPIPPCTKSLENPLVPLILQDIVPPFLKKLCRSS